MLGGPQSPSVRDGEEKKSRHCPRWELNFGRPVRGLVTILTELPHFLGPFLIVPELLHCAYLPLMQMFVMSRRVSRNQNC